MGVEISLLPDEGLTMNAVVLKLEKNKIRKEKEFHFLGSFEELLKKTGVGWPLAVSVNGKGVLQKKLALKDLPANPVETILPNANPGEFYHSVTESPEFGFASVSVIRKEVLDKIIGDLKDRGFKVLSVSIGISDIQYLAPFLSFEKKPVLTTTHFTLYFNDQKQLMDVENTLTTAGYDYEKTEYNIGDQYVYSPALLAFGSATGLLATGLEADPVFSNEAIRKEREDYTYYSYYKAGVRALLAGIFVILLINFFIYDHYFSKNKEWQDSRQMSLEQEEKIRKLGENVQTTERFLSQSGWEGSSRLSYIADRIAGLVPSGSLLTGLKIYPLNTGLGGEDSRLSFRKDTIQIMGVSEDPTELNQFANNLRNIADFKEVNIRSYLYKKEMQTGVFFMEIITR